MNVYSKCNCIIFLILLFTCNIGAIQQVLTSKTTLSIKDDTITCRTKEHNTFPYFIDDQGNVLEGSTFIDTIIRVELISRDHRMAKMKYEKLFDNRKEIVYYNYTCIANGSDSERFKLNLNTPNVVVDKDQYHIMTGEDIHLTVNIFSIDTINMTLVMNNREDTSIEGCSYRDLNTNCKITVENITLDNVPLGFLILKVTNKYGNVHLKIKVTIQIELNVNLEKNECNFDSDKSCFAISCESNSTTLSNIYIKHKGYPKRYYNYTSSSYGYIAEKIKYSKKGITYVKVILNVLKPTYRDIGVYECVGKTDVEELTVEQYIINPHDTKLILKDKYGGLRNVDLYFLIITTTNLTVEWSFNGTKFQKYDIIYNTFLYNSSVNVKYNIPSNIVDQAEFKVNITCEDTSFAHDYAFNYTIIESCPKLIELKILRVDTKYLYFKIIQIIPNSLDTDFGVAIYNTADKNNKQFFKYHRSNIYKYKRENTTNLEVISYNAVGYNYILCQEDADLTQYVDIFSTGNDGENNVFNLNDDEFEESHYDLALYILPPLGVMVLVAAGIYYADKNMYSVKQDARYKITKSNYSIRSLRSLNKVDVTQEVDQSSDVN